ncbi:MAG: CCA tRNA nucleotidyltransferase, partial [Pseudomonadota bacterium]
GGFDAEGLAACRAQREGVGRLSRERVGAEMAKLLAAPDPGPALRAMVEAGVMAEVWPEAPDEPVFVRAVALERALARPPDWLTRLAALFPRKGGELAERLRLSKAETARLKTVQGENAPAELDLSPARIRAEVYRRGGEECLDMLLGRWVASGADPQAQDWRAAYDLARDWSPPVFPLTGADAMAAGLKPGPDVGGVLREVEAWWIGQEFEPDEAALRARLAVAVEERRR